MKKSLRILALLLALCMALSLAGFASSGEASAEASDEVAAEAAADEATAALESKNTADMSPAPYSTMTSFTGRDDTGRLYIGNDVTTSTDIVLNESVEGAAYTAVYAHGEGVVANITGTIVAWDDTPGDMASDFSGQGAMIVADDGAVVNVNNAVISTDGFERSAAVVSAYATVRVIDSELTIRGANPLTEVYEGYTNGADMALMVSPPWVLGIQGAARGINMIGANPVLTVIGSSITSGAWATISTDSGSNMTVNVVDSELSFLPESEGGMDSGWRIFGYEESAYSSGYGCFNIGSPAEYFYGTTISGATFAAIIMGAKTDHYASSNGSIDLVDVNGELLETVEGQGQPTVINCVFGIMQCGNLAEGLYMEDGTVVNTEEAVILHKSGNGDYYFDEAVLNPASGVLFQMIDSDDDTRIARVSGNMQPLYDEDNVTSGIGFPGVNYDYSSATGGYSVSANYSNGSYEGNIYNGSGYYDHSGNNLTVTVGENAVLTGDIALTSTVKGVAYSEEALEGIAYYGDDIRYVLLDAEGNETEDEAEAAFIQIRSYTITQYFLQGHVENLNYYNGASTIEVVVEDGAEWIVAGESLITKLTVAEGASVKGVLTENEDGTLTITAGDELIPAGEYGTIEAVASGEMDSSASGEASGEASAEITDAASAEIADTAEVAVAASAEPSGEIA